MFSDAKGLHDSEQSVLSGQSKQLGSLRTSVLNVKSVLNDESKSKLRNTHTAERSVLSRQSDLSSVSKMQVGGPIKTPLACHQFLNGLPDMLPTVGTTEMGISVHSSCLEELPPNWVACPSKDYDYRK